MIFDIERNSFVDGPGIRTTVFFKGCNLHCAWCHNPESQSGKVQLLLHKRKCTGCGKCREKCPNGLEKCELCGACALYCPNGAREICGREYTVDEVMTQIEKDRMFYENSGGGVTLSGGECLMQADFCAEILKELKKEGIHTAVDTCGFVPREAMEKVIPYTDIFLYDFKAYDEEVHIRCTGQSNRRILENLRYLEACGKPIEIRIPYVPRYNCDQMEKLADFLSGLKNITKVKVLPYHNYASSKYEALNMENTLPPKSPTDDEIATAQKIIKQFSKKENYHANT
jgi:pyruvate formate lyase activating enzyme